MNDLSGPLTFWQSLLAFVRIQKVGILAKQYTCLRHPFHYYIISYFYNYFIIFIGECI